MGQFFAENYTGPGFELFRVKHIGALLFRALLRDYDGETTPANNLEYMAEEQMT